jgi:hypothetical protein
MILCGLNDLPPEAILGSTVTDPHKPGQELLRAGVPLDKVLIATLRRRGVTQLWIEDGLTKDLDIAVAPGLTAAKLEVYKRLRDGLAECAAGTVSCASIQDYRAAALEMVTEAISSVKYASMTDSLFNAPGLASHGTNVAYLSLLCGLHIQGYVVAEQPRLDPDDGRELSVLGIAGMLHDIGKAGLSTKTAAFHDVHARENGGELHRPERYPEHISIGRAMLANSRAPARVAHTILNHHQRVDGQGWPDMTAHTAGRVKGPLAGKRIHIFTRIVAAANVLDNLLHDAHGAKRPPVAALHEFASERFDGWFDPIVRRTMLMRIPPFAIGTSVVLSDGRRAVVVAPTLTDPCRPVVRIIQDHAPKSGSSNAAADDTKPPTVDLHATPGLSITHALGIDVARYLFPAPPPLPRSTKPETYSVSAK